MMNRVLALTLLLFSLLALDLHAQRGVAYGDAPEPYAPIQAIRTIDTFLLSTEQSVKDKGMIKLYQSKLNIARSFVHAGKIDEAMSAYHDVIDMGWRKGDAADLEASILKVLKNVDYSTDYQSRKGGYDENHQLTQPNAHRIAPSEAADNIDEALAFLHDNIIQNETRKIQIEGDLEYCRHLVETNQLKEAKAAYHKVIIQYLDPFWTSQLLKDIEKIMAESDPSLMYSDPPENAHYTCEEGKAKIREMLEPLSKYSGDNAEWKKGIDSAEFAVCYNSHEKALLIYERTIYKFSGSDYAASTMLHIQTITEHMDDPKRIEPEKRKAPSAQPSNVADAKSKVTTTVEPKKEVEAQKPVKKGPPIYYFKNETDSKTTESIRIMEKNELVTYRKVSHNWGGKYYFINEEPTTDKEWLRVWEMYLKEQ